MAKVTLRRPLAYKVIVTEQFRQEMGEELQRAADEVQGQLDQLDFQSRRYLLELQKTNLSQAMAVRDEIEKEKRKQQRVKEEILNRKKEISEMPDGERFLRGMLEGIVEVSEGDNLRNLLTAAEILVKDDVVIEIKDGREQS